MIHPRPAGPERGTLFCSLTTREPISTMPISNRIPVSSASLYLSTGSNLRIEEEISAPCKENQGSRVAWRCCFRQLLNELTADMIVHGRISRVDAPS